MFESARNIIGLTVGDVEQALTEQYGRAALYEKGRVQNTVTYVIRIGAKASGKATIIVTPVGVNLRIEPYSSTTYVVVALLLILIGTCAFVLPGIMIALYFFFVA